MRLLLDDKADVNASHKDGVTTLCIAAQNGHVDVVKLLLDHKADVNACYTPFTGFDVLKSPLGERPLDAARRKHHLEIVKLLQ